jgi:hypothetical protein
MLHLQHTRHQLSLAEAGLHCLDMDSMNFSSDNLHIYVSLQMKARLIRKECQLWTNHTFVNRLQRPIAKINPTKWVVWLLFYKYRV